MGIGRISRTAAVLTLMAALAGCGVARDLGSAIGVGASSARGPNQIQINGTVFRSKLRIDGPEKRDLTITVRPVRVDPGAAQEAGRYRATVYCLRKFGSSATDWTVGPDIPVDQLQIADDTITLQGSCSAR